MRTNITVINASCHPDKHKMAMFKNWMHRLNKLPLSNTLYIKIYITIISVTYATYKLLFIILATLHVSASAGHTLEDIKLYIFEFLRFLITIN
jgi:hypothetical protein